MIRHGAPKENPLDPDAWLTERHRFDMAGETADIRLGVHTTPSFGIALSYAVHKASQEGPKVEDATTGRKVPNCGIIFELDMAGLDPVPEADAVVASSVDNILIDELREVIGDPDDFDLFVAADVEVIAHRIYAWSGEDFSGWGDDHPEPTEWWDAYIDQNVGKHDISAVASTLDDMAGSDPVQLAQLVLGIVRDGQVPGELWAASIQQWRYLSPVGISRVLAVYAVRPVDPDLLTGDDEDEENGEDDENDLDAPQKLSADFLDPDVVELWSGRAQLPLFSSEPLRVEYHGTDVLRARAAFPELAEIMRSPWHYGQPRGVGPA